MNFNWFISRRIRVASQMGKHVEKILSAQRDILSLEAIQNVEKSLKELREVVTAKPEKSRLDAKMTSLETTANKWLRPYPHAGWRENVEVLLVAIAVAMGIRTFFVQPFKIPTGSMQPTLYGVTSVPDFSRNSPTGLDTTFEIPSPVVSLLKYWVSGIQYKHVVARSEGRIKEIRDAQRFLLFNLKQQFFLEDDPKPYTVWFPPENMAGRAGLVGAGGYSSRIYKKGEDIVRIKAISGDHLFVDRLSYNFRRPKRGEIVVFKTQGIEPALAQRYGIPLDQFYIKRLIGLEGDRISIGEDQHLRINGVRLDSSTPGFERLYDFKVNAGDNEYFGHTPVEQFANGKEYLIRPRHCLVMGDNTRNSLDSRFFGDFQRDYIIGRSFFVYWPIGRQGDRPSRFGWGNK